MFLIVGLGNPGTEYEKTRHNIGFMVLDAFTKKYGFSDFSLSKKHASLVSEGFLGQTKVILAKPQTLMNNSGKAVKSLVAKYQIPDTKYLVVVHDDIDIPLGKIKISIGRGSAGHKGVQSIIQSLRIKDFTRIRVGIQPEKGKPEDIDRFVLQHFKTSEFSLLRPALQNAIQALAKLSP